MSKDVNDKITQCETCGCDLRYKTKKPRWCKEHNPYKDTVIYHSFVTTKSKLENQVQKWLMEIFPSVPFIAGGYFSWIPSPKGYPLQLDFLVYGVMNLAPFAIEVDGVQHNEKQSFQTQEDFDYLKKCDQVKEIILRQKGYKLVRVSTIVCKTKDDFIKILEDSDIDLDLYNGKGKIKA